MVAIYYILNLWPLLGVYLDDGRIEIDQNLCENAIRPLPSGKKNWLFIGDAEAGERSAILYTSSRAAAVAVSIPMLTYDTFSLDFPLPRTGK